MNYNKERLLKLLKLVKEITDNPENLWFKESLLSTLKKVETTNLSLSTMIDIKKDTNKVVEYLSIKPECSIDYSFIKKHQLLRTRLEIDNIRMENVRYNLNEKDEMKRLYDFCINAFFQIENLINYFYFEKYPQINDLMDHFEGIPATQFKRSKEMKNIGDVSIGVKIFSFNRTYFLKEDEKYLGMDIDNLRKIRNEGLHRCTRIKNIENENIYLHKFLKFATFDSVHSIVNSLALKIKMVIDK
jgi:hypothetical protein